ncbi:GSCOCG00005064001-RA-CDS, partial [Cotesia congregata]
QRSCDHWKVIGHHDTLDDTTLCVVIRAGCLVNIETTSVCRSSIVVVTPNVTCVDNFTHDDSSCRNLHRHDHGFPPRDRSTRRVLRVTCQTGKVTRRFPFSRRISSDLSGSRVRLPMKPIKPQLRPLEYVGVCPGCQVRNSRRHWYSKFGRDNTCNRMDMSFHNHRRRNHNSDRAQNSGLRNDIKIARVWQ